MNSKAINVFILLFALKQTYGEISSFICQNKLDNIFTQQIFVDNQNDTNSIVDIIIGSRMFIWNLKAKISEVVNWDHKLQLRIYIPTLPVCYTTDDDCQELYKLSDTSISFSLDISNLSYKMTKFSRNNSETDCDRSDLPWNMSASGDPRNVGERSLWPQKWIRQKILVAAYDPSLNQLVYAMQPDGFKQSHLLLKRLTSNKWDQNWESIELTNFKSYVMGMVTLMPEGTVKRESNKAIRKNLDRLFLFGHINNSPTHEVHEFFQNRSTESDYDYLSIFNCPKPKEESHLGYYLLIGVSIVTIVCVLAIICSVGYYCGQNKPSKTTQKTGNSSSSGGFGSRSESSVQSSRRKSFGR